MPAFRHFWWARARLSQGQPGAWNRRIAYSRVVYEPKSGGSERCRDH